MDLLLIDGDFYIDGGFRNTQHMQKNGVSQDQITIWKARNVGGSHDWQEVDVLTSEALQKILPQLIISLPKSPQE